MQTDICYRIQTDIDQNVGQSTKSNQSQSLNKNMLTTQFRRFMALPNNAHLAQYRRNFSPSEATKQTIVKQTQQDISSIFNVQTPSTTSKKRKKINLNYPNSRPQRINTDIYEDYANNQILLTETNNSTRVGSSCGRFLMPQSVKSQGRTKSVGKESVRQRTKNLVAKIYCGNSNQLSMYYDSNLTNMMKQKRNKSSQGDNVNRSESSTGKFREKKYRNELTPSTSPQNRPLIQGRQSKLNYLKDSAKRKSVISIDNENSLFQISKNSETNSSLNQYLQTAKNSTQSNFQVQFRNRQQLQQQVKQEGSNLLSYKQQKQNYISTQSQCTSTEDDVNSQQKHETKTAMYGGKIYKNGDNIKISSNDSSFQAKQYVDAAIIQQNKSKKRSYTQESENLNRTTYNFLEYTKRNDNNKENSNFVYFSQNQSKVQSRMDRYKDYNRSQQPSSLYQRKHIQTESSDFESQNEFIPNIQSDIRNKNNIQINFTQKNDSIISSTNKVNNNNTHDQSINNNSNNNNNQNNHHDVNNQNINDTQNQQKSQQQQQYQNHQRIAQIVSQQQQQEKQQTQQIVHPKIQYEMTDDEWNTFGDRFPKDFTKIKLLGRGGFALVWLGEDNKTKEQYAIKQVSTKNVHQTHIKEIWFGSQFFENGQPKQMFKNSRGIHNMIRLAGYDLKPVDTWLFYELSGDSLGTNLYDLKGEGKTSDGERIYRIVYKEMYVQMRSNINILKQLIYELAHALLVISDQKIVHSDLKPENILIQTRYVSKNKKNLRLEQVKLIDYGSAFTFGNLKNFSMATPEYMAPEILNYILYTNNLNHNKQLVEYLKDYNMPHVIDMWSLGCVVLELINGIPLWMSLKTKIIYKGQELIKCGLFAVKNRVFESIIQKQIETINNLDTVLDEQNYSSIAIDDELRDLLKRMLKINPCERISPKEIIEILQLSFKGQQQNKQ